MPPALSVLIRSMNRDHLARALRSIAAQDHPDAEVLVVNASGAAHRALPERCGAYPLRLVDAGTRLRRPEAGNAALEAARGEALYFLDDDDETLPGGLSALTRALAASPGSMLAHGRAEIVDKEGRFVNLYGSPFRPEMRFSCGFFGVGAFAMSRELVALGVRFDTNLEILEDLEFFAQCSALTTFTYVDRVVHRYWSDAGTSGAGFGGNEDPARIRGALSYIHRKWQRGAAQGVV